MSEQQQPLEVIVLFAKLGDQESKKFVAAYAADLAQASPAEFKRRVDDAQKSFRAGLAPWQLIGGLEFFAEGMALIAVE